MNWTLRILGAAASVALTVLAYKTTGDGEVSYAIWPALIAAGAQIGSAFIGGGGGEESPDQKLLQSDIFSRSRIGAEGGIEGELAGLQQGLFRSGANALGQLPGGLDLNSLAAGRLPLAARQRIDRQAFGGLNEGLARAQALAGEQAASRGIGLSSIEGAQAADLQRPLIAQAGRLRAGLENQELNRLGGLRQGFLSSSLALQNSPALSRLLQIRAAQKDNVQLTREPGGLPDQLTEGLGVDDQRSDAQKGEDAQKILAKANADMIAKGIPKHARNKAINALRKRLAAEFGIEIGI